MKGAVAAADDLSSSYRLVFPLDGNSHLLRPVDGELAEVGALGNGSGRIGT